MFLHKEKKKKICDYFRSQCHEQMREEGKKWNSNNDKNSFAWEITVA